MKKIFVLLSLFCLAACGAMAVGIDSTSVSDAVVNSIDSPDYIKPLIAAVVGIAWHLIAARIPSNIDATPAGVLGGIAGIPARFLNYFIPNKKKDGTIF